MLEVIYIYLSNYCQLTIQDNICKLYLFKSK